MKRTLLLLISITLFTLIYAQQEVQVKDGAGQLLLQINDEGDNKSSVTIPQSSSVPSVTDNKLYNDSGTLKWSGNTLGIEGSADGDWTISSGNIYSTVPGNVGIGTESPSAKLTVAGSGALVKSLITSSNAEGSVAQTFENSSDNNDAWSVGRVAWGSLHINYTPNGIYGSGGEMNYMAIKNDGNLGIGTSNPFTKLDVNGNTKLGTGIPATDAGILTIASPDISTPASIRFSQGIGGYFGIGSNINQDFEINQNGLLGPGAATLLLIDRATGNVGIGTTNPLSQLSVGSSGSVGVAIYAQKSGTGSIGVNAEVDGASSRGVSGTTYDGVGGIGVRGESAAPIGVSYGIYGEAWYDNFDSWAGYFNGRGYFSGNVGIGTTNPLSQLSVGGNGTGWEVIYAHRSGGNSVGVNVEVDGTSSIGVSGTSYDGVGGIGVKGVSEAPIGISYGVYGGTNYDNFDSWAGYFNGRGYFGGNVGIGTTSPTELLDVNSYGIRIRNSQTPSSSSAEGYAGQIAWDSGFIYVCTDGDGPGGGTDTWKRSPLSTW